RSSYLGGTGSDAAMAVSTRNESEAYITGVTCATDFPIRGSGVLQSAARNFENGFVAKVKETTILDLHGIRRAIIGLPLSTYLGGPVVTLPLALQWTRTTMSSSRALPHQTI